eukprot:12025033-Alexandrium_andersonii.AAC.1
MARSRGEPRDAALTANVPKLATSMQCRLAQRLQNSPNDFQEHFQVGRHATEQTEAGPPPTDWASYVQAVKRPA